MLDAYVFDSELTVYAKKDRLTCITNIRDKLGVPGTTDGSVIMRSMRCLLYMDNISRTLRRLKDTDSDIVFFKYLIAVKKDGSTCLLFNSKITPESDRVTVEFEGLFVFQDIIEAIRIIECSVIDAKLECMLKDMYSKL